MTKLITKMAFEKHYSNHSRAIEYAVRLNTLIKDNGTYETYVDVIDGADKCQFPTSKINWLIECLGRIKEGVKYCNDDISDPVP